VLFRSNRAGVVNSTFEQIAKIQRVAFVEAAKQYDVLRNFGRRMTRQQPAIQPLQCKFARSITGRLHAPCLTEQNTRKYLILFT